MSERTHRTPQKRAREDWAPKFLEEFERVGMVSEAAKLAGVHRQRAYERRDEDEQFAAAWDAVVDRTTEIMERAAYMRGTTGVEKPVFQGGVQVGTIREYSDTLLMFMLKSRRPDLYRENHRVTHVGADGGPLGVELRLDEAGREALANVLRQRPAAGD